MQKCLLLKIYCFFLNCVHFCLLFVFEDKCCRFCPIHEFSMRLFKSQMIQRTKNNTNLINVEKKLFSFFSEYGRNILFYMHSKWQSLLFYDYCCCHSKSYSSLKIQRCKRFHYSINVFSSHV